MSIFEILNPESNFDKFNIAILNNSTFDSFINFDIQFKEETIPLEKLITSFLLESGNSGKTRSQICSNLDIPRSTIYDCLSRMSNSGLIEIDHRRFRGKRGRPQTLFYIKGLSQGNRR